MPEPTQPQRVREAIQFRLDGQPVPKGRPRFGSHGRVYTPVRTKEYEEAVRWCYRAAGGGLIEGNVAMTIDVYEPKGHPADLDNYVKIIMDGLNGVAFKDDRQVTVMFAQVWRGEPEGFLCVVVEEA